MGLASRGFASRGICIATPFLVGHDQFCEHLVGGLQRLRDLVQPRHRVEPVRESADGLTPTGRNFGAGVRRESTLVLIEEGPDPNRSV